MLLGRSSGQVAELHEIRFEAASLLARIYAEQVATSFVVIECNFVFCVSLCTSSPSLSFARF